MQASAESLHWAAEWDRRNPPPALWRLSYDLCSTKGLCAVLGVPVNGVDLAAVVAVALLLVVFMLLRRPRASCALWCALVYGLYGIALPYGLYSYSALDDPETRAYQQRAPPVESELTDGAWDCRPTAYLPGKLERVWLRSGRHDAVVAGRICALNNGSANMAATREHWLRYAREQHRATAPQATRRSIAASDGPKAVHTHYAPLRPLPVNAASRAQL